MVKRHFYQKIRTRKFEARNEIIGTVVLVKTRIGKNASVEEKQGDCYLWKAKGLCTKGNACIFRHDESKRAKETQSSCPTPRPQTQNDGKSFSKGTSPRGRSPSGKSCQRPCRNYFNGRAHDSWGQSERAIPRRKIKPRKNSAEGPSQGIQHSEPHERSPYAPKFEDRSEEETLKQERCARRVAWEMAKSTLKLTENEKATFYSLSEVWCPPAPSSTKPTER